MLDGRQDSGAVPDGSTKNIGNIMAKRKAPTLEEIRAANAKHDTEFSANDKIIANNLSGFAKKRLGPKPGGVRTRSGQRQGWEDPKAPYLGMRTPPQVGNYWKWSKPGDPDFTTVRHLPIRFVGPK
tara:strand:- start:73 stop:450 length:378 start_codon:yes stop_codon:yes gene_type:complete